jgi:prophage antirepressor-like protein
MTEPLKELGLFEGKPIHTVEYRGETWIPLNDLAAAWGTDRTTPYNIVVRNSQTFEGYVYVGDVTSQTGMCVNEQGLYILMGKVVAGRLKNKEAQKTVIRFQRWVPELIKKFRKGELSTVKSQKKLIKTTPAQAAREGLAFAKTTKSDARTAVAAMLKEYGYDYLISVLPSSNVMLPSVRAVPKSQTTLPAVERPLIESLTEKNMIAPSPKPAGMLSASDIADSINQKNAGISGTRHYTAEMVNKFLYNNHFIVYDADNKGEWRITELGKQYGTEKFYRPNPKLSGFYRVFWNHEILEKFNVPVVRENEVR